MAQIILKNPDKTAVEIADLTVGWFNHAAVQPDNKSNSLSPEGKEAAIQRDIGNSIEEFWGLKTE